MLVFSRSCLERGTKSTRERWPYPRCRRRTMASMSVWYVSTSLYLTPVVSPRPDPCCTQCLQVTNEVATLTAQTRLLIEKTTPHAPSNVTVTRYAAHWTPCKLNPAHWTLHTKPCTLNPAHWTLHTEPSTLNTAHSAHCTFSTPHILPTGLYRKETFAVTIEWLPGYSGCSHCEQTYKIRWGRG